MRLFRWLSAKEVPDRSDLRRCGWNLLGHGEEAAAPGEWPALAEVGSIDSAQWVRLLSPDGWEHRGSILLLGVDDASERARLLRLGFGDVLDGSAPLAEVEARAERIGQRTGMLPRIRKCGPLHLDLLLRDAFSAGRAAHLHPREFALLWRLTERPGRAVSRLDLLKNVWGLRHQPETNSIAVHVCRLRDKLAALGCDGVIATTQKGDYLFDPGAQAATMPQNPRPGRAAQPRRAGTMQAA